jgi:uncharacterized membrane-anchored protein
MTVLSIAIYRGNTDLIHDYHQSKVTDRSAYGKAFGKAMLVVSAALLLSGIIGLLDDSSTTAAVSVAVLFVGLIIGIACIVAVQRKYNKVMF